VKITDTEESAFKLKGRFDEVSCELCGITISKKVGHPGWVAHRYLRLRSITDDSRLRKKNAQLRIQSAQGAVENTSIYEQAGPLVLGCGNKWIVRIRQTQSGKQVCDVTEKRKVVSNTNDEETMHLLKKLARGLFVL
jgi:hypothetical protein